MTSIVLQLMILFAMLVFVAGLFMLRRRTRLSIVPHVLWMAGLTVATGAMPAYQSSLRAALPGFIENWPTASRLVRDRTIPTLIMFAHPRCECTKASLSELRRLMSRVEGKVRCYVLFARSEGNLVELSRTENWTLAQSIRGATIVTDEAAREADQFGAKASGQVMLYDSEGRILFTGGIAPLHMHPGDSPMFQGLLAAIESASEGRPMGARVQMPNAVTGCALRGKGNADTAR